MCDVLQTRTWPLDKAGHEGVTTFYSRQGRAWGCDDRLGRVVDKGVTNHYSRQAWAWGRDERVGRVADGPAVLRRRHLQGLGHRQLHYSRTHAAR